MDKQFLTPEELKQIKDLNTSRNELVNQFGILEFDSQSLELQKEKLIDTLQKINKTSEDVGVNLQKKYGDGNVNIETGEFVKN